MPFLNANCVALVSLPEILVSEISFLSRFMKSCFNRFKIKLQTSA